MERAAKPRWLTRSLVAISAASLFSDMSHELVTALLPSLLVSLGAGSAALGLIEGLSDALSSFAKLWGGWLADHTRRRVAFTVAGYGITGTTVPLIGLAASVGTVFALRALGWFARGFRTPIRETLLVESVPGSRVNRAFGFHRTADTVGAFLGPLAALVLVAAGMHVRTTMLLALIPGVLAPLAAAFVVEHRHDHFAQSLGESIAALPRAFRRFVGAVGIFGIGNFSHTLLILVAVQALTPSMGPRLAGTVAVALYMLHNLFYAAGAYPAALLSERVGAKALLVWSYLLFSGMCVLLASHHWTLATLIIIFILAGGYISVMDPMEGVVANEYLPSHVRGSGFGILATVNGIGDLVSSATVGLLWARFGPSVAFMYAALTCAAGAALLARLPRPNSPANTTTSRNP
jgi:MFS family permease